MHAPHQRTLRAHAKINLTLRVLAREASGYHGLETLFQRLALADVVHVALTDGARSLECDGPAMPAGGLGSPEQNLAWRAASLYADAARWDTGWQLAIEKHIPVGGGLGGGSSNAAAVLRAMDAMSPSSLGTPALVELAGTLGADVPFFVADTSLALAWNRGDRMLALPALPRAHVSLVTFDEGVHTGAAFQALAASRNAAHAAHSAAGSIAYAADAFSDWRSVASIAANDFEDVASEMHDGVQAVLPLLRHEARERMARGEPAIGLMSGSGATCYLLHTIGATPNLALPFGTYLHSETA